MINDYINNYTAVLYIILNYKFLPPSFIWLVIMSLHIFTNYFMKVVNTLYLLRVKLN